MNFSRFQVQNVQMFLSDPFQMGHIFFPDDMSFFKSRPLELPGSDFGDIVGQDGSHGLINGNDRCRRFEFVCHTKTP